MSRCATGAIGVFLILASVQAWAAETTLRLCTGPVDGNYAAAGQEIRRQVARHSLDVRPIETDGSIDNMQRMAKNECDAGIAQIDAYLQYQARHPDARLQVEWPRHLYEEYLHLVCRRDTNTASIRDLPNLAAPSSLVVGAPGSGSAITWDSITRQSPDYLEVETVNGDNAAALKSVTDGAASCLMVVSGLSSDYLGRVEASGEQLRLLMVDDETIIEAKHFGKPIYAFRQIPKDTYPGLQGPTGAPVQTLAVRAVVLISSAWASEHAVAYGTLVDGLERAAPIIRSRVAAK